MPPICSGSRKVSIVIPWRQGTGWVKIIVDVRLWGGAFDFYCGSIIRYACKADTNWLTVTIKALSIRFSCHSESSKVHRGSRYRWLDAIILVFTLISASQLIRLVNRLYAWRDDTRDVITHVTWLYAWRDDTRDVIIHVTWWYTWCDYTRDVMIHVTWWYTWRDYTRDAMIHVMWLYTWRDDTRDVIIHVTWWYTWCDYTRDVIIHATCFTLRYLDLVSDFDIITVSANQNAKCCNTIFCDGLIDRLALLFQKERIFICERIQFWLWSGRIGSWDVC